MTETHVEMTERDRFILEKAKHFKPGEIVILLEREGFEPVTRARVYQLLKEYGLPPLSTRKK